MSRTEKIQKVRDALVAVLPGATYHYTASARHSEEYCVWQEEKSNDLKADNKTAEIGMQGTIDLFTKTEYSTKISAIEQALGTAGISHELNSVQFETDTSYIHCEWVWYL